jgi:hypothetical protein
MVNERRITEYTTMTAEPYQARKIPDHWVKSPKRVVIGRIVAVSGVRLWQRGTELIYPRSRAFPQGSIVELTVTDDKPANPGDTVNSVLYLGFFEVQQGGIIVVGESVEVKGTLVGVVAGFSDIHYPNHLNLIVTGTEEYVATNLLPYEDGSMVKLEMALEDEVFFGRAESRCTEE